MLETYEGLIFTGSHIHIRVHEWEIKMSMELRYDKYKLLSTYMFLFSTSQL